MIGDDRVTHTPDFEIAEPRRIAKSPFGLIENVVAHEREARNHGLPKQLVDPSLSPFLRSGHNGHSDANLSLRFVKTTS